MLIELVDLFICNRNTTVGPIPQALEFAYIAVAIAESVYLYVATWRYSQLSRPLAVAGIGIRYTKVFMIAAACIP